MAEETVTVAPDFEVVPPPENQSTNHFSGVAKDDLDSRRERIPIIFYSRQKARYRKSMHREQRTPDMGCINKVHIRVMRDRQKQEHPEHRKPFLKLRFGY